MTRLFRFLQLENGWIIPSILLALVLLPVLSLNDAGWIDRTQDLLPGMLLGAVVGVIFGKARLHRFLAVPLGVLSGAGILYVWFGELIPPLRMVTPRVAAFPEWLLRYLQGRTVAVNPLEAVFNAIASRNDIMAGRLWDWIVVGTEGGYSSDNFVFFFLLALLMCTVAFYTAWCLYRYRNALVAVMPVGITLVVNTFLSNRGLTWIIVYVMTTMVLLMAANLASRQRAWQKKDIDYSTELNFDLTVKPLAGLRLSAFGLYGSTSSWWDSKKSVNVEIPSYFNLDAVLACRVKMVEVFLKASNIFNQYIYTEPIYPWRGRFFEIGAKVDVF